MQYLSGFDPDTPRHARQWLVAGDFVKPYTTYEYMLEVERFIF